VARLKSIIKGDRQIFRTTIPLKNMVGSDGAPVSVPVGLTILNNQTGSDDYGVVLAYATKYAQSKGAEPKSGVEAYDYGKAVATIAIACVDPDSPLDNLSPFFGTSDKPTFEERVLDVLSNKAIGRDTILFLAECQDVWQEECSPQPGSGERTPEQYHQMIAEVVTEGPLGFLRLNASSRLKFLHFTACLLLEFQMSNTMSGSSPTTNMSSGTSSV
jgi:hypothetical protein